MPTPAARRRSASSSLCDRTTIWISGLSVRAVSPRLPQAPETLLGMIDVRGQGIPVVDLRMTLGLPPAPDNENTRILVLSLDGQGGDLRLGLRADRVFEVTILDEDELDPPPSVSGTWTGRCIAGIGRRNGRFVTVLDLERLLGSFEEAVRAA